MLDRGPYGHDPDGPHDRGPYAHGLASIEIVAVGLDVTATFAMMTPGTINWGDGTTAPVAIGQTTAQHTYAAAGPAIVILTNAVGDQSAKTFALTAP